MYAYEILYMLMLIKHVIIILGHAPLFPEMVGSNIILIFFVLVSIQLKIIV